MENTSEPNTYTVEPTFSSIDRETVVLLNSWLLKSPYKDKVLKISTLIGPHLIYVIYIGITILCLITWNWEPFFEYGGTLILGVIVFMSIKYGINRRRPFLKDKRITRLDPRTHKTSFPSGHSFWVSLIFLFVSVYFGAPWWVIILMYDLSIMVSLCRIALGAHYPTDLMMGHLLSALCLAVYFWLFSTPWVNLCNWLVEFIF